MLEIYNWRVWALTLVVVGLLSGCKPPGAKALLEGRDLLEKGEFAEAVERLETAASILQTNAQAFNYLGLAQHHAGDPRSAQGSYLQAIRLDPDLSEARYNLGCLYLEQNRLEAARAEFTAYTLRLPKGLEGWLKLGATQERLRDFAGAEKSFGEALRLAPEDAEAWNGIGMARLHRGRITEARQSFERALQHERGHAAAWLNLGIVHQQYLKDRGTALQVYRQYLALQPAPPRAAEVAQLVRQLEAELAPAQAVQAQPPSPAPAPAPVETAAAKPPQVTNAPAARVAEAEPAKAAPPQSAAPRTEVASARPKETVATNMRPPQVRPTTTARSPAAVTNGTVASAAPKAPPPTPTETVKLADEPEIKVAQDLRREEATTRPQESGTGRLQESASGARAATDPRAGQPSPRQKRGLLSKLNPLNLLPDKKDEAEGSTSARPQEEKAAGREHASTTPAVIPRYAYRNPPSPKAGNRAAAEQAFAAGNRALSTQRIGEAIEAYKQAGQLDGGYYEAFYNLGVVLSQSGDASGAMAAYEQALAARPTAADARYNFALLLKQSGYFLDAASQLETLVRNHPNDARAHFAAGNLYAQELRQASKARSHYVKFVELDPRSPQAAMARQWLAGN